jgi:hypothetical protein
MQRSASKTFKPSSVKLKHDPRKTRAAKKQQQQQQQAIGIVTGFVCDSPDCPIGSNQQPFSELVSATYLKTHFPSRYSYTFCKACFVRRPTCSGIDCPKIDMLGADAPPSLAFRPVHTFRGIFCPSCFGDPNKQPFVCKALHCPLAGLPQMRHHLASPDFYPSAHALGMNMCTVCIERATPCSIDGCKARDILGSMAIPSCRFGYSKDSTDVYCPQHIDRMPK